MLKGNGNIKTRLIKVKIIKDKYEGNLNLKWKQKIPDATEIIYEKKEIKNEEISKKLNQNYFKDVRFKKRIDQ